MGRLIDVDKAEKMLRKYADDVGCNRGEIELANGILKAVCCLGNIPTAYDTEKVIEQLNDRVQVLDNKNKICMGAGDFCHADIYADRMDEVIEARKIVERGGIGE